MSQQGDRQTSKSILISVYRRRMLCCQERYQKHYEKDDFSSRREKGEKKKFNEIEREGVVLGDSTK